MTSPPATGTEPNRPAVDGPLAPTESGHPTTRTHLTRTQKALTGLVSAGTLFIAGLGFAGSYEAVTAKAHALGFGWFSNWITIGVDAGIGVFLALDLLLTWLRMPYPLLRHVAWVLTSSTIVFNASASWPNPLGVAMHSVIPVLFVAAVEAARHAVGRIADVTVDKYMEGPPVSRWLLNPLGTFVLWRRQHLWQIRTWREVLGLERERRVYVAQLRRMHGRGWRRKATVDQMLLLSLAKDGMSITEARNSLAELARAEQETSAATEPARIPVSATRQPAANATASTRGATQAPATARRTLPATAATATQPATRSATTGIAGDATKPTDRSATPATREDATAAPATTETSAPATGEVRYEPGTPQHVVHTLWLTKGHRPTEGEIVDALGGAGLANSRAQAGKIRRQVASENPSLPGPRASAA